VERNAAGIPAVLSRGGPWRGVVTAEPTDRGGPPRKNQEFNHEWPRNQRRAVTSSEPGHPLPPGALPTTAPPLVSYINILFTSLRAAITRCASLYYLAGRRRTNGGVERRSGNKNGRGVTCLALFSLLDGERKAGDRRLCSGIEPRFWNTSSEPGEADSRFARRGRRRQADVDRKMFPPHCPRTSSPNRF